MMFYWKNRLNYVILSYDFNIVRGKYYLIMRLRALPDMVRRAVKAFSPLKYIYMGNFFMYVVL